MTGVQTCALPIYRPTAGALRGFGIPQLVWAYECHTDLIARGLGIDPVEYRRRTILRDGRVHASGTVMRDAAIDRVLDAIATRMNWSAPFDRGALDRSLFESSRWLRVSLNERSGAAGGHDAKAAKGRLARHLIQRCAKGGDVERALRAFRDPRFVVAID